MLQAVTIASHKVIAILSPSVQTPHIPIIYMYIYVQVNTVNLSCPALFYVKQSKAHYFTNFSFRCSLCLYGKSNSFALDVTPTSIKILGAQ